MLSAPMIERRFENQEYDQLLESLTRNGLTIPLPLRVRLSAGPAGPLGLGLRRLVELTYGPTALSRQMTHALLGLQNGDGSFAGAEPRDPLATACAAAALGRVHSEHPAAREPHFEQARIAAIACLASQQDASGLFRGGDERTETDAATSSAFVLYLLGSDELFRRSIRYAELLGWFEEHEQRLDRATRTLWEMCRVPEEEAALWAINSAA